MNTSPFTVPPSPFPPGYLERLYNGKPPPMVHVVRSPRRRKTVSARVIGGTVQVLIPASMSKEDEGHWVCEMLKRFEHRHRLEEVDLAKRARALADRYGLGTPTSISWSDNQNFRWGSCTPGAATIRINSKLVKEPAWVLDYVIVHELAHLDVGPHNKSFWELVARYPLAERARGFLIARGVGEPEDQEGAEDLQGTEDLQGAEDQYASQVPRDNEQLTCL